MSKWAYTFASWRGVPLRVHANTPLGLLLFTGFEFRPLAWACVLALILIHELGHVIAVRWAGARPIEVMLTGFGGHCAWTGKVSDVGRAGIASGGIAAQWVVLVLALGSTAVSDFLSEPVLSIAIRSNAWLMALNFLPFKPLDGTEAWSFPYRLGKWARLKLEREGVSSTQAAKDIAAQLLRDAREEP
jgi:stage IV sporulation protein FB